MNFNKVVSAAGFFAGPRNHAAANSIDADAGHKKSHPDMSLDGLSLASLIAPGLYVARISKFCI